MPGSLLRLLQPVTEDIMTPFGKRALVAERRYDVTALRLPRLLADLEATSALKMTPRSYYDPQVLQGIVEGLATPVMGAYDADLLDEATEWVSSALNIKPLVLSDGAALASLLVRETDTAAGAPWFAKRYAVAFPYLPDAWLEFSDERAIKAERRWKEIGRPDVLDEVRNEYPYFTNYRVEANYDVEPYMTKHRLVWGAPFSNQILEAKYAIPIQMQLSSSGKTESEVLSGDARHGELFSYLPGDVLHGAITRRGLEAEMVVSVDYAAFDQTIASELIQRAFDCLQVPRDGDGALIRARFVRRKLLSPWGDRDGEFGVPSGSVFTNLVDGVVNAIAQRYAALRHNWESRHRVNGDDGILFLEQPDMEAPEKFSAAVAELGLEASTEKQALAAHSAQFNRAYWGPEFDGPVPSLNKTANSLARHDAWRHDGVPSLDEECDRALQVLMTARHHPLLQDLISRAAQPSEGGVRLLDYRARLPRLFVDQLGSTAERADALIAEIELQLPTLPETIYDQ